MRRAYCAFLISRFLSHSDAELLGKLTARHEFALEDLQRDAWLTEIAILKRELAGIENGYVFFEYAIPRMGKRTDVILLIGGNVFVLEFKVGAKHYGRAAIDQVTDYALDLSYFHKESHTRNIVPILVATLAPAKSDQSIELRESVATPLLANSHNIATLLSIATSRLPKAPIDPRAWALSPYQPTPTIVEAAQALYRGHTVTEISRSDASAINLSQTNRAIATIIAYAKERDRKCICFVTGVPGSGKTLAGLNIANERLRVAEDEHAVFLSGNGPLVKVLQEALARNEVARKKESGHKITKKAALSETRVFIQNIHHFRDDSLLSSVPPVEKVVIFDEAQRAWTEEQTSSFMKRKKGVPDFSMSEPEFLISVMDRHSDWATIICLVGGGQEINTGEAGLQEWFKAVKTRFPHWRVFISNRLVDMEYNRGVDLSIIEEDTQFTAVNQLHLSVSIRSFRSEKVSTFVKALLDRETEAAQQLYSLLAQQYPIFLTRDINTAKEWLRERARGSERFGIVASSKAYRLRPYGVDVKNQIDPSNWFLNDRTDVRSSYFLEDVATEFDIQGLELDWVCVAWGADFRYRNQGWQYKRFSGQSWNNVNNDLLRLYLKNSYRVLLTRARQGMIIFVPLGEDTDPTRSPRFYEATYTYLSGLGIPCI